MRKPLSYLIVHAKLARWLAEAFVAGPWSAESLNERGKLAVNKPGRWLRPLVDRLFAHFDVQRRPTAAQVASFLRADKDLALARLKHGVRAAYGRTLSPEMWPARWDVPPIATPGALAEFLALTPGELDWFADRQGRLRQASGTPLGHYRDAWRRKSNGNARLIEAPKPRLKVLQRCLLDTILAPIPPHDAAHGFRPGRSIRTFAAPHAGQRIVLRLDLHDFFPSVSAARVVAVFLTAGYPEPVARMLAGLCTRRTPSAAWKLPGAPASGPEAWRARRLYDCPHLPQGAPTSPALANLAAYRLDLRLAGLATVAGAVYTRYADDLAFSGGNDLARSIDRFSVHACAVALEEGFVVNTRKTRVLRRGVRQRLAGVVVNAHPNLARDDYDRLKAILHNCIRFGPSSQNREAHPDFRAHLTGRVAHLAMLNPERGRKLREMTERIGW